MANKKFTESEMALLCTSPYVLSVSPSIVHFSAEFKEEFWNMLSTGMLPQDIVVELGIDAEILGINRVMGLKGMIRNEVKAGKGFRDLKTQGQLITGFMSNEEKIRRLEHQLAYKEQEVEFLKKIVSLGKEDQAT